VRQALDRDSALAATAARAIAAGATAYGVGTVIFLGGHRAVGLMATHSNPIQATNSIAFTIDSIDQAFDVIAYALCCAGLLAFAWIAWSQGPRAWPAYTSLLGLMALVIAWSYAGGGGDLKNELLFADGLILLPGWLIGAARMAAVSAA
jgi:hypothetical protein